ncbi:MAG: alpha/beta fold hydrolase, partial [Acidimicrobiales bacterium]
HGASPPLPSYDVTSVADTVHQAVIEAGLRAPVVVGHSMGAVIATVYAGRHPASGVVNVDQSLQVAGFARLLHSLADRLRGPDFPSVWETFRASFHTELLSPDAQELIRSTSHPDQDLVLGYWRELLEIDPAGIDAWSDSRLAELSSVRCPYLFVVHDELGSEEQQWLREVVPQATQAVWPDTGHFPHLAHPQLFADYLAATDRWPDDSPETASRPPAPGRHPSALQ